MNGNNTELCNVHMCAASLKDAWRCADEIDSDDLEDLLFNIGAILAARSGVDALTRCAFDVAYCSYTADMTDAIYGLHDSIDNLRDALNGYR